MATMESESRASPVNKPQSTRGARRRLIGGAIISVVWLMTATALVHFSSGWPAFLKLPANAIGDFLAGVFAPLAFFWLVIGYFQQSEELRLQREQLRDQKEELALQRQETKRLADEANRQASAVEANEINARRDILLTLLEMNQAEQNAHAAVLISHAAGSGYLTESWAEFGRGNRQAIIMKAVLYLQGDGASRVMRALPTDRYLDHAVGRFIQIFEAENEFAEDCDPNQILREGLEFGPVGSLYAKLCLVANRPINFMVRPKPNSIDEIH